MKDLKLTCSKWIPIDLGLEFWLRRLKFSEFVRIRSLRSTLQNNENGIVTFWRTETGLSFSFKEIASPNLVGPVPLNQCRI